MQAVKNMYVEGLIIKEVPITNGMKHRPFQFGGDGTDVMDELNSLGEMVSSATTSITPGMVARSSPSLLTISPPLADAYIPNGYGEQRFSFVMSIRITYIGDRQEVLKITGFSDNIELVSATNALNLSMPLYMSSVVTLTQTSNASVSRLDSVSNVLLPDEARLSYNEGHLFSIVDNAYSVQRPDDVFGNMIIGQNSMREGVEMLNMTDKLYVSALSSDTINNDQFGYTTRIINAYNQSAVDADADGTGNIYWDHDMSLFAGCHMNSQDDTINNNVFISALQTTAEGKNNGVFTLEDVMKVDPTFSLDRVTIYRLDTSDVFDYRDYTSLESSITITSEVIAAINFLVSNLMERFGVFSARILITNMSMDAASPWLIDVLDGRTIGGIQVAAVKSMTNAMYTEVPMLLASLYSGDMTIEISANSLSETIITATLEGYAPETKAYPAYAENTYSPLIVPPGQDTMINSGFSKVVDIIGTPIESEDEPPFTDSAYDNAWDRY